MKREHQIYEDFISEKYDYLVIMGWVVVLQKNKPVNYYADCGVYLRPEYCQVDKGFELVAAEYQDQGILEAIRFYNSLKSVM